MLSCVTKRACIRRVATLISPLCSVSTLNEWVFLKDTTHNENTFHLNYKAEQDDFRTIFKPGNGHNNYATVANEPQYARSQCSHTLDET